MTSARKLAIRWLVPTIGGIIALSAVFFLYRSLDFDRFLVALQNAKPWWVAMLAAAILLEQCIHGWKWRQLLHDLKPISTMRLTGALLAGYGANTLVPLGISPLVRSWLIAKLEHLKVATPDRPGQPLNVSMPTEVFSRRVPPTSRRYRNQSASSRYQ